MEPTAAVIVEIEHAVLDGSGRERYDVVVVGGPSGQHPDDRGSHERR